MIKIVLWDIDGTLTNFKEAEAQGIKNCFKEFKLGRCTKDKLQKYTEINDAYWKMLEREEISKPELLVKRFDDFFALYDIKCDSKKFNEYYQEQLREVVVLNKGAKETVDELEKMKVPQYVVTNGLVQSQNKKLKKVGLENNFLKVFISDDLGYDKPTVEFFKPVFDEINKAYPNVNKDEIMIIGDSLTSDIQGGINTGIKTCWYNPGHVKGNIKCDYEIDDLNEVLNIVKEPNMANKKTETKVEETKKEKTTKPRKPRTKKVVEEAKKEEAVETKVEKTKLEVQPEVKEAAIEPKKNHLKDIVDTNYRVIIVCLAAIALLFICLFVGTRNSKNTYALNEFTTTTTEESITLPKNWYITNNGYGIELDGKYANLVMQLYVMDGVTSEEMAEVVAQAQGTYEIEDITYGDHQTYFVNNISQSAEGEAEYDCTYMVMSDDEVLCIMFTDVDRAVEDEILSSIK